MASCASYAPRPLADEELPRALDARTPQTFETLRTTLAEARVGAGDFGSPDIGASNDDPRRWRAHAFAWNAELRQSRRQLAAAFERAQSAGLPNPIAVQGGLRDAPVDLNAEAQATFDLIRIFGLEPAAAARALADAEIRRSLARLESALWDLRFAIDADLVRLASSREALRAVDTLLAEAREDARRIETLLKEGRVGRGPASRARAMIAGLADRRSSLLAEIAKRSERLATRSGFSTRRNLGVLEAISEQTLDLLAAELELGTKLEASAQNSAPLLTDWTRLPVFRLARRNYALAEARLRDTVAETWPELRVGPRFTLSPEVFPGGLVGIEIPFPGRFEGEIGAAKVVREAAREALEDLVLRIENDRSQARRVMTLRLGASTNEAGLRREFSGKAWRAARAAFGIHERYLGRWIDAFESRGPSLLAPIRAREEGLLAAIQLESRCGGISDRPHNDKDKDMEVRP